MRLLCLSLHLRLWSAVAAIVLLHALGTRTVEATCGDWLAHPAEPGGIADEPVADQPMTHLTPTAEQPAETHSTPRPTDCRGPLCRQAPSPVPTETPPARIAPVHRADACQAVAEATAEPGIDRLLSLSEQAHLLPGFPAQIDRPPRAA